MIGFHIYDRHFLAFGHRCCISTFLGSLGGAASTPTKPRQAPSPIQANPQWRRCKQALEEAWRPPSAEYPHSMTTKYLPSRPNAGSGASRFRSTKTRLEVMLCHGRHAILLQQAAGMRGRQAVLFLRLKTYREPDPLHFCD